MNIAHITEVFHLKTTISPNNVVLAKSSLQRERTSMSTSAKGDSSCSEESNFLAPAPYASPYLFTFSDSSRIWTTSPSSPGSFSASSSVSATSSSAKEDSSWSDQSKILAPAPMLPLFLFLFSGSSCFRPPSCVSTGFISVSSFFKTSFVSLLVS